MLCCFVNSYWIDFSCSNYKGFDISADIKEAVNEVIDMIGYAHSGNFLSSATSANTGLLTVLFGPDPRNHQVVNDYIATLAGMSEEVSFQQFDVICDDLMVTWAVLPSGLKSWWDHVRNWWAHYDNYTPCDPARKPGSQDTTMKTAYTISNKFIYLCPVILDNVKGRTLARYRDQQLTGQELNSYMLVPGVLFYEIARMHIEARKFSFRSRHLPFLNNTKSMKQSPIKRCEVSLR